MTENNKTNLKLGLEGVVVAETHLSRVDGQIGSLIFMGHSIGDLAEDHDFESVAFLLLEGRLPKKEEHQQFQRALGNARVLAFEALSDLGDILEHPSGMGALRGALGHLQAPDGGGVPLQVIAATAVIAAAWVRTSQGKTLIPPDGTRSHAEDYLFMATGFSGPKEAKAIGAYLTTVMDHGLNASTFTARVIASTGSDLVSCVCGAVGALKGPLHGGAPGPVLDMLDAIGTPDNAGAWLENELNEGRRIMGMGHRVYRVRDPRAAVLQRQAEILAGSGAGRITLALQVEAAAEAILKDRYPNRDLKANVEFFTAVLLEALFLPREAFSLTFAVGRVVGWCAHVNEGRKTGKLIRPKALYVGAMPPLAA